MEASCIPIQAVCTIDVIQVRIECLAAQEKLDKLSDNVKKKYTDVFSKIPHVDKLPKDIFAWI